MSIFNTDLTPEELSWEMFNFYFPNTHRLYLITIKPPNGECRKKWVANDFCKYLRNKGDITHFWLVPSKSPSDYDHYHGVIKVADETNIDKFKNALRTKVNRGKNFLDIRPISGNRERVYNYIKNQRSTQYEHGSMLYITILE